MKKYQLTLLSIIQIVYSIYLVTYDSFYHAVMFFLLISLIYYFHLFVKTFVGKIVLDRVITRMFFIELHNKSKKFDTRKLFELSMKTEAETMRSGAVYEQEMSQLLDVLGFTQEQKKVLEADMTSDSTLNAMFYTYFIKNL